MSWNPTNWIATLLVALSPAAPPSDPAKPAVVLVHGIHDTGKKMTWLAHRLQLAGYETFCPTLTPSSGALTLEASAAQLDNTVITRFGHTRPLHIVGFSMGGLITRYWLAHYPIRNRAISYATLSTPHHGTAFAYINSKPGVLEMRPRSPFLNQLSTFDPTLAPLHPLSLYTPFDLIILPYTSSTWSIATNESVWKIAHPLMVFSPLVAHRVLQNMQAAEK